MTRFIADQNKLVLLHESGLYGSTSGNGFWIGQVTDSTITDTENKIEDRFLGASTRSFVSTQMGPRDVKGSFKYYPQDMRIPFFMVGSVVDTSGPNSFHLATQIATNVQPSPFTSGVNGVLAPISFTLEDSKQSPGTGKNFVRTIVGCVPDTMKITAAQGKKVEVEIDYIGQTLTASSGTTTTVSLGSNVPYLWNNCTFTMNGSILDTATQAVLTIKQNLVGPHYLNGSRDIQAPYPKNRDNLLDLTLDLDGNDADMLYNSYYKSGTSFNATFDMNADVLTLGSQHTIFGLSGCRIVNMDNPSTVEGVVSSKVSIIVPIIIGSSFDSSPGTSKYNPW